MEEWDSHTELKCKSSCDFIGLVTGRKGLRDGEDLGLPKSKPHDKALLRYEIPEGDICRRDKAKSENTLFTTWGVQPKCNFLVSRAGPEAKKP